MVHNDMVKKENRTYLSCCDIHNEEGKVIVNMEMPGVSKDNLTVKVNEGTLIIDGKRTFDEIHGEYLMNEIRHGDYHHEFTIDETIDRNKIEAAIRNGLVTLTLWMKESEKPRKIEVVMK